MNLTVASAAGIARVILNRPDKRNALNRDLVNRLATAVGELEQDDSIRVLILTGAGSVFCAGMDLAEMQSRAVDPNATSEWNRDTDDYRRLLERLFRCQKPTVAVMNGPALAGGVGLVLACDMVLASSDSFLSLPEPRRGITAAVVSPLLTYRVGTGPATYMLLSGRRLPVEVAHRWGLVHEVVPTADLADAEKSLCREILTGAPSALATTKKLLLDQTGGSVLESMRHATEVSARAREADDAREGLAAFLEKRFPSWHPSDTNS